MNISATSRTIGMKFYLKHHSGGRQASVGFDPDWIRSLVTMATDTPFTIKHILLHCVDVQNSRNKNFKINTLKELCETIEIHKIVYCLKEIGLFYRI